MPVGGGKGGIYAQVWRLHPATPYGAPYGGGGPANQTPDGAPFQTLNSLILSYIDQALSNIVPSNTSGSNVVTNPASLSVTAFDGLGTFTFSATASYAIDGQYVSGSFSTTDSATLLYSFHEVGFTPDGAQFTLDDQGGGTLNIHANNGNSITHSLTNTLTGSDSYALTRVLVQSDAVAGSFTSAEDAADTIAGSDGFTMTETQTETVNTSGSITGGSDTYIYDETGSDTSSQSEQGSETVAGAGGVNEVGTSSATGSGSGGHTYHITGTDAMGAGGFLPQGTHSFTWGGSDSEGLTTTATDSHGVSVASNWQADSVTTTQTTSESASHGETGSESYTDSEGTSFSWQEAVGYSDNSQSQGWVRGTETSGEADGNPAGGGGGEGGSSSSMTDTGGGHGQFLLGLTETGSQALSDGLIGGGTGSFYWYQIVNETDTDVQTGTESSSGTDSGTEAMGGDWTSSLEIESASDATTVSTTEGLNPDEFDRSGTETFGSYGLVLGGSESVSLLEAPALSRAGQGTAGATVTAIASETDAAAGGLVTDWASAVETDQDTSGWTGLSYPRAQTGGTRTLGAGGMIIASALTDDPSSVGWTTTSETDIAQESGTETGMGPGESSADSFSTSDSDVINTTEYDYEAGATETEQGSIAIGAGGAVAGGYESTSFTESDVEHHATTTETDSGMARDTASETVSEGGDSDTTTLSTSESDAATTTETASDTATEAAPSSETLGAAGVVLAGSEYDYEYDSGTFAESGSDTGSGTVQEQDVTTGEVGGNTTSDSVSTSESESSSGTSSDGGAEWTTTSEHTNLGPGGIVTGGDTSEASSDIDSPTETVHDTHGGSDSESESDAQAEAGDVVTDSVTGQGTDSGTVDETDSDTVTAFAQSSDILGAAGDVLSGFVSTTETDVGSDQTTDRETSTETTTETDSSSEAVGGETITDQETDTATETDQTTDTESDAPTDWEQSSETYGAAGIVLGGSSSTTLNDTLTDGETTSDVDVDTDTQTESDWGGISSSSLNDYDLDTATETETLTGTDASTDTDYEGSGLVLGAAGLIISGSELNIETGTDTGSSGDTLSEQVSDTVTDVSVQDDTGDTSTDSTSETGSDTINSSDPTGEGSAFSESLTETLGAGGAIVGGSLTRTYSETVGAPGTSTLGFTHTTTATDSASESFDDTSDDSAGANSSVGHESDSDTSTETETGSSKMTGTLMEVLGADGTIVSGAEYDSVSETSGDTITETDHPIETVTESASDVTMTLTNTVTHSDTANESDQEWATETLGTSGTICGGSDCFTISSLETSNDTSTGSGPENYNDTSSTPNGTATVTGSGASSSFRYQRFGDVLGVGGDITSGGLTYTVTSSETDAATTTESGTETLADELSGGPSQTASYSVTTTMPDNASAWETGTETLGDGGTINGGTASFSWSDGDSLNRHLTISGIAAILGVTEDSTDTYGFGESGTETITTGGADAPGTVSFTWDQMGTDHDQVQQGNSWTWVSDGGPTSVVSYLYNLTNSESSSWHDAGSDVLTDGDTPVSETDNYQWNQSDSVTDQLSDTYSLTNGYTTTTSGEPTLNTTWWLNEETGWFAGSLSVSDSGCETLSAPENEYEGTTYYEPLTASGETDQYRLQGSQTGGFHINYEASTEYSEGTCDYAYNDTASSDGSKWYSDSLTGSSTESGSLSTNRATYDFSTTQSADSSFSVTDLDFLGAAAVGVTIVGYGPGGGSGTGYSSDTFTSHSSGTNSTTFNGPSEEPTQSTGTYSDSCYSFGDDSGSDTGTVTEGGVVSPVTTSSVSFSYAVGSTMSYTDSGGGETGSDSSSSDTEITYYSNYKDYAGSDSFYTDGAWTSTTLGVVGPLTIVTSWSDGTETSSTTGESSSTSDSSGSGVTFGGVFYGNTGFAPDPGTEYPLLDFVEEGALGGLWSLPVYYQLFEYGWSIRDGVLTNAMTADGLPDQEANAVNNLLQSTAPPDGVSRSAPPSPTATLITLAAAGREPTDLTLPTAGSEAVDPPPGSHLEDASGVEGEHWYSSGVNWYPGGYFNPGNWPGVYTAVNGIQQWQRGRTLDSQRRALEIERDQQRTTDERIDDATDPKRGILVPHANLTTDRRVHALAEQLEDDANTGVAVLGAAVVIGSIFLPGPEDLVMGAVLAKFGYRFLRQGRSVKVVTEAGKELTEAEAKVLLDAYKEASADVRKFLQKAKLSGEVGSTKNVHLFENRNLTVREYIAKYRKGGIKEVLPSEAADMTVEQALRAGKVGNVNVRKLLLDTRDKFVK